MEGKKKLTREHFTQVPDLEFSRDMIEKDEEMMERQVVELAPALVDIGRRAMTEKPDFIVCTDKSARIFGVPLCKFIEKDLQPDTPRQDKYNPHLTFFNDDYLKDNMIVEDKAENLGVHMQPEMAKRIVTAFSWVKGKKFFVVDEALAIGRSLRSLLEEIRLFNGGPEEKIDVHFFSLSQDDDPSDGGRLWLPKNWKEFLAQTLDLAQHTDNFQYTLYDNHIHEIFSKSPLFRYVINNNWRTKPVSNLLVTLEELRQTPEFDELPPDVKAQFLGREESARKAIPQVLRHVGAAKKKLYQTMQQINNQ